ncbi:hypothetical protein SNE35_20510 [Paucibacter sp. R3-3]|uniref:Uncharacterized protein n=1 Tax=Roseateles agri TaxID=3098619 RepID=A0ABU5DPC8_9BURK|nr:hypothetical protein [Paucibacter sp. R3-3]MDY0746907.1 hypothetical protein [Paucibacter sp. R3-3]
MPGDQLDDGLRRIRAEEAPVVPGRLAGKRRAAGEQALLVLGERCFDIARIRADGLSKLGAIQDRQVGAFAGERRHQMGGIADQGDFGHSLPTSSLVLDVARIRNFLEHFGIQKNLEKYLTPKVSAHRFAFNE